MANGSTTSARLNRRAARRIILALLVAWCLSPNAHGQERLYDPYKWVCANGAATTSARECAVARRKLDRIIEIQRNASPSLLEFESNVKKLYRAARLAVTAKFCLLRSDRYVLVFAMARDRLWSDEARRLHLSIDEVDAANYEMQRQIAQEHIDKGDPNDWQTACSSLANSPLMDKLDALHRELTGNYH